MTTKPTWPPTWTPEEIARRRHRAYSFLLRLADEAATEKQATAASVDSQAGEATAATSAPAAGRDASQECTTDE